jgi:CHASE2 domain-containing sensor protein
LWWVRIVGSKGNGPGVAQETGQRVTQAATARAKQGSKPPGRRLLAARWLGLVALLGLLNSCDPVGLVGNTERYSSDLFNRAVAAATYRRDTSAYAPVVILWTREDLLREGVTWPVRYERHAEVLKALREAGVRAAMLDIAFVGERWNMDDSGPVLGAELARWARPGAPGAGRAGRPILFVADPAPVDETTPSYQAAFWRHDLSNVVPVGVPGAGYERVGQVYPYYGWFRPLEADLLHKTGAESGQIRAWRWPSAACSVYAVLHSGGSDWCLEKAELERGQLMRTYAELEALKRDGVFETGALFEVAWRTFPGNDTKAPRAWNAERHCRIDMPRPSCRAIHAHLASAVSWLGQTPSQVPLAKIGAWLTAPIDWLVDVLHERQTCGPQDGYHVWQLLEGSPASNREVLEDRVVFVGVDLVGISDSVEPPTHTPQPGVFLHAMAYEDLVRTQGVPLRHAAAVPMGPVSFELKDVLTWFVVAVIVTIWLAGGRAQERALERAQKHATDRSAVRRLYRGNALLQAILLGMAAVAIVGTCALAYFALNLAPINFVGLFGLLVIGKFVHPPAVFPPGWPISDWPSPPPDDEPESAPHAR